jgi:hypothetical protein
MAPLAVLSVLLWMLVLAEVDLAYQEEATETGLLLKHLTELLVEVGYQLVGWRRILWLHCSLRRKEFSCFNITITTFSVLGEEARL